jgi:hypothetical protein
VLFGRPRKLTPHQCREAIARRDAGETLMDIAAATTSAIQQSAAFDRGRWYP